MDVDRIEAQNVADLLGIEVTATPEDHETLTAALWTVVGLGQLLPESVETRWEFIAEAVVGGL